MAAGARYMTFARTAKETPLPAVTPLLHVTHPLSSNDCFSGSTVLALSKYYTHFSSTHSTFAAGLNRPGFGCRNNS
jgi:hypothetical protein